MPRSKRLTLVRDEPESRLSADARAFDYALNMDEKSPETRRNYSDSLRLFERFLVESERSPDTQQITRLDIEQWLLRLREEGKASSTRHLRYAALSAFFSFCLREEIIEASPMAKMRAPKIVQEPLQVLTDDQVRDVLKVCGGSDFKARRDMALIRVLMDTGLRRAEVAGITRDDWLPRQQMFRVKRKGGQPDVVYYKPHTAAALDKYWRMREKQRLAERPEFWITSWGPMSADGIATLVREIGTRAGIERLHVHQFRHLAAHDHLATGGGEGDLMRRMGWSDRTMLDRYAKATQKERARDNFFAHKTIGDRL